MNVLKETDVLGVLPCFSVQKTQCHTAQLLPLCEEAYFGKYGKRYIFPLFSYTAIILKRTGKRKQSTAWNADEY